DEQERRSNIIATRVYLIVLLLSLISISIFAWASLKTTAVTLKYLTKEQLKSLPIGVQCPCSRISISYNEFTLLEPIYHEICSSDFVSDRWINAIYTGSNATYFNIRDFRSFSSSQFQALAAFCHLSKAYVQQSIDTFHQSTFISLSVLSENDLQTQLQLIIDQFQQEVPQAFTNQLDLILRMTMGNKIVSGLLTNYIILYGSFSFKLQSIIYHRDDGTFCDCQNDLYCTSSAVFDDMFRARTRYISNNTKVLPGIASGCLPIISMLDSTLECFYNQTCLNDIISYFPTNERFSALVIHINSSYNQYTKVKTMLENLMIEEWITTISYEKYYDQCAPISCTYSKEERHNLIYVITKLISLLSGLTLVLELIIPIIVRFIMKKLNHEQAPSVPIHVGLNQVKSSIKKAVIELNYFKHYPSNDQQIRYQRYGTRLYILLIAISAGSLSVYHLTRTTIHRETILNLSLSKYLELSQIYATHLYCPCTSISTPYFTFISIEVYYHQLCSSYLVSSRWIAYSKSMSRLLGDIYDYRINAGNQFQTLSMFCEQAQQTINNSLTNFLKTHIFNLQVIRKNQLETQLDSAITDWKSSTINQFISTIDLIRNTTQGNQLMNRLNIFFQYPDDVRTILEPRTYGDCNCAFFARLCSSPMKIFTDSFTLLIENFYVGCYLIDALFLSTLECFYNEICMSNINHFLNSSLIQSLTFPALSSTKNSPNQTIRSIFEQMMVDQWSWNINYSSYYNHCAPNLCIIQYKNSDDIFTVIIFLFGIFGGLSIGFRIPILLLLRLTEKFKNNFTFEISIRSIKHFFIGTNEQQMTRRLQIVLVSTTLCILYITVAFNPQLTSVEIKNPSLSIYENLVKQHSYSLQCSCSQIAIPYGSFINIKSNYHPSCSRDFIGELWMAVLIGQNNPFYQNVSKTYIYSGVGQLQALSIFCELSKSTVSQSVTQFLNKHMVNTQLLSPNVLSQRIQMIIDEMKTTMPKLFINTFSLVRQTTKANKFLTTFGSTWLLADSYNPTDGDIIHTIPVEYDECDCGLSSECFTKLYGVIISCYILEGFLQSTFECLYDQECVDKTHTFPALNLSINPSRFPINSTVESVLNELMIENFTNSLSYSDYFTQCSPSSCIFSYIDKFNIIEGITTLISLYGGLMIICQLFAVIIIKILPYRLVHVTPVVNISTN
ncbi:unnamed protein product, partial [Rotaria sp. Silwood1]